MRALQIALVLTIVGFLGVLMCNVLLPLSEGQQGASGFGLFSLLVLAIILACMVHSDS